jgi:hypothetical protein
MERLKKALRFTLSAFRFDSLILFLSAGNNRVYLSLPYVSKELVEITEFLSSALHIHSRIFRKSAR